MILVNNYAIVPASVRYDKRLAMASVIVYAEISASVDAYGVCDRQNSFFSEATNLNPRTVTRAIAQLIACKHIERVRDSKHRAIRIISRFLPAPNLATEAPIAEDINQYCTELLDLWEAAMEIKLEKREMFTEMIQARLVKFSKEELLSSVKNKINYVTQVSDWHMAPENRIHRNNITLLIRDDDEVFKYLNMKQEEAPPLKKFDL